jgi:fatty acid desaturase
MATTNRSRVSTAAKQATVLALLAMVLAAVEQAILVFTLFWPGKDDSVLPVSDSSLLPVNLVRALALAVIVWVVFLFGKGRGLGKARAELDTAATKLARSRKAMRESANPFRPARFARILVINLVLIASLSLYFDLGHAIWIGAALLVLTLISSFLLGNASQMLAREQVLDSLGGDRR